MRSSRVAIDRTFARALRRRRGFLPPSTRVTSLLAGPRGSILNKENWNGQEDDSVFGSG